MSNRWQHRSLRWVKMMFKNALIPFIVLLNALEADGSSVDIPCTLEMDVHNFTPSESPARIKDFVTGKQKIDKERAIECLLMDKNDIITGKVLLEIVIAHDPPTMLLLHVAHAFTERLHSKRLICSYSDIGAKFHVGNKMPKKMEVTGQNGTYVCSENGLEVIFTGLLRDPSIVRKERELGRRKRSTDLDVMCVRTSLQPAMLPDKLEVVHCWMKNGNGTLGFLTYNEQGILVCSRCCDQMFLRDGICYECPVCSTQVISVLSSCDPIPCEPTDAPPKATSVTPPTETSDETSNAEISTLTPTPTEVETPPTPQHAPVGVAVANATATSVCLTWNVLALETFTHYLVCVEGSSTTTSYRTNGTRKELHIESLEPDTEYKVTVAATNFNETGPRSEVIKIKTLFQIPDLKDFNSSVDANVAHVTWLPHGKYNLMIMVNLTSLDSVETKPEFRTVSDSDGKLDLHLREPGTYEITGYYFDRENNRSGTKQAVNVERPVDQAGSQTPTALWVLLALVIVLALAVIAIWHRNKISQMYGRVPENEQPQASSPIS